MIDPTEYDPNSRDSTDDPDFVGDANHIGNLTDMVVGDNDHGDAIPEPKCGVCLCNKALKEDLRDSLEAHDEMRLEIAQLRKQRDSARRRVCRELLVRGVIFHRIGAASVAVTDPRDVAKMMDWDCFEEKEQAFIDRYKNHIGNLTDTVNKETP